VAALRILAARRLTEAQLWARLSRKEYQDDDIRSAVAWCKAEGYLDDALFAQLYVDGRAKAVGDTRLIGELVRRGVDREAAAQTVARSETSEEARLARALEKLLRNRPSTTYPSAARALERLGFPAPAIYRHLRAHATGFPISQPAGEDSPAGCE
jgi:regulatory protein